jgi:hypothetical protein
MFPSSMRRRAIGGGEADQLDHPLGDNFASCSRVELIGMVGQLLDERKKLFGTIDRLGLEKDEAQEHADHEVKTLVGRHNMQEAALKAKADEAMVQMKFLHHVVSQIFENVIKRGSPKTISEVASYTDSVLFAVMGDRPLGDRRMVAKSKDGMAYLAKLANRLRGYADRGMTQGGLDLG